MFSIRLLGLLVKNDTHRVFMMSWPNTNSRHATCRCTRRQVESVAMKYAKLRKLRSVIIRWWRMRMMMLARITRNVVERRYRCRPSPQTPTWTRSSLCYNVTRALQMRPGLSKTSFSNHASPTFRQHLPTRPKYPNLGMKFHIFLLAGSSFFAAAASCHSGSLCRAFAPPSCSTTCWSSWTALLATVGLCQRRKTVLRTLAVTFDTAKQFYCSDRNILLFW